MLLMMAATLDFEVTVRRRLVRADGTSPLIRESKEST
jgi:hypothetical protein